MTKQKIVVVGKGNWGKKVISTLKKKSKIVQILDSKTIKKKILIKNIDWAFILTPYNKHFYYTKFFLNKKINVFCEKPFDENPKNLQNILNFAKAQKKNIYIDDIELYKKKKILIKKINHIKRYKLDEVKIEPILYRLAYHDIYLLIDSLQKLKKIKFEIIKNNSEECIFKIYNQKRKFYFDYKINSKKKIHKINQVNFLKFKNNPLNLMIDNVLFPPQKKIYLENNLRAQLTTKILRKISNLINK